MVTVTDPLHEGLAELRQKIHALQHAAGPELQRLLSEHDFGFSTMNVMTAYSKKLLEGVAAVKEIIEKLNAESRAT